MMSGCCQGEAKSACCGGDAAVKPGACPADKGETKALPTVWSDSAGFQAASKNAEAAFDKLSVAAGSGDMAALTAAFGDAGPAAGELRALQLVKAIRHPFLLSLERVEVLGHLPQQKVGVAPNSDQAVRPEQQPAMVALERLAELQLGGRLPLGGQASPGRVQLVEGVANDLAFFRWGGGHGRESNEAACALLSRRNT